MPANGKGARIKRAAKRADTEAVKCSTSGCNEWVIKPETKCPKHKNVK